MSEEQKNIGTSVIFLDTKKRVLLYKRDDIESISYPGKWDILGGNLESGETPLECITRELLEEIEYDEKEPSLFRVFPFDDRTEYTYFIEDEIDIATTPLHEGQYLQWFSRDQVLEMPNNQFAFGFKKVICDFFTYIDNRLPKSIV